ncbi:sn-glycerol-3-phosphate import ATP-binding protein UgpC [bioreactor metagenome]|uniref:sn-glycerol-3-phosphate import ATP-binding protein UgpC n=1 Tax=bioreactor metagenome TaxID=1076179 RepID=A0A644TM20_9ZZZZ|nr:ABC transporter ATP-binding protein [Negativicutes bacterium]
MAEVIIQSVTKKFGEVKAVNDFSATIADGEFVSILGPSGCGKTTMLRMVAGFERPTEGDIYIGDKLISSGQNGTFLPPEKRNIGMVFQSYAVWPHMTVFQNIAYPLKIQKVSKAEMTDRTNKALELVHLEGYGERFPHQLSGGQQQRVALARALVGEPRLLLLDEPLSNLDAKLRESMRFEIKDLQKKLKITVIYVTHDQAEAMAMSDRIIVMNQGIIQQNDKPQNIYENPTNKIVADFIGLVNFLPAEITAGSIEMPTIGFTLRQANSTTGKGLVAVRPEHITISKTGSGLSGTLLHKFYLGDSIDYRVKVKDEMIRVIDKSGSFEEYPDGETVYLEFNKLMAFPQSGK